MAWADPSPGIAQPEGRDGGDGAFSPMRPARSRRSSSDAACLSV